MKSLVILLVLLFACVPLFADYGFGIGSGYPDLVSGKAVFNLGWTGAQFGIGYFSDILDFRTDLRFNLPYWESFRPYGILGLSTMMDLNDPWLGEDDFGTGPKVRAAFIPGLGVEIMLHDGWTLGVEGGAFLEILNPGENAYGSGWFISVSFLKFMPAYAELHPQR